ncbi:MAG: Gfo/Idh/MocA family oxidoreductase [Gemmataceae bacterium]
MSAKKPSRRSFLQTSAVAGTALSLSARSYAKVAGANGQLNVAFLGVGGRCQMHVDVILAMQKEGKGAVPFAVCDVWDGNQDKQKGKGQGLYPTAKRCGLDRADKSRVSKDYRTILANKDVDVVCVATPDHWHTRMVLDAFDAGKDVYCEKPMTKTIAEATAIVDAWKKSGRVMTVGVQSMSDPVWHKALELVQKGGIGHVLHAQTRYFRNSDIGMWRNYYLTPDMNPKTVDWDMFLGHKFEVNGVPLGPTQQEVPFDRAVFAQWRCYWPFGSGMFTDLFVHQMTHLIYSMGVRYPRRVVGAGGLYLEYDGRDVPDVATVVADYDEGCQALITSTMCNNYPIDECIRGKTGTINFLPLEGDRMKGFEVIAQNATRPGGPGDFDRGKVDVVASGFEPPAVMGTNPNGQLTYRLWENFLDRVKAKKQDTFSTPELGAAAFTTVALAVDSYRTGKVRFWDKEQRKAVDADPSWPAAWEQRSKQRGKPNQIIGWQAGDTGSTLRTPADAKYAGPWVDGKDPAGS